MRVLTLLACLLIAPVSAWGLKGLPVIHGDPAPLILTVENADPSLESETIDILNRAYNDLYRASGFAITDTARVVYVSRQQSFDSVVGGRFPDWGVAAAVAERNLIAVRSPADYPLARTLRETLQHELAHLHLDAMSGLHQLPRWMHEGYAQQVAHQWEFGDDALIARAVFFGQDINLTDIDGVNSFGGARAQLAYAESYLAMNHFLAVYGWDGLQIFCETLRQRADWDEAFRKSTGADYAAYQHEFTDYLNSRYNWIAFLGDTALFWVGLVGVFVVIYIVKRRRTNARRAEWEAQEAIEDALYSPLGLGEAHDPEIPTSP